MDDVFAPHAIALLVSDLWQLHKGELFSSYLVSTCGRSGSDRASFDKIYIAQAEEGDIPNAVLRSAANWWQVDDTGFRAIHRPELPAEPDAPENVRGEFYIAPIIRFFNNGNDILIGESYGPKIFSRKVGVLIPSDERLVLTEVRVLLTYDTL